MLRSRLSRFLGKERSRVPSSRTLEFIIDIALALSYDIAISSFHVRFAAVYVVPI